MEIWNNVKYFYVMSKGILELKRHVLINIKTLHEENKKTKKDQILWFHAITYSTNFRCFFSSHFIVVLGPILESYFVFS